MLDSFILNRIKYSCTVLNKYIDLYFKESNGLFNFEASYNLFNILDKSLFMDCIECLYVTIPEIMKEYFRSINIERLSYIDKDDNKEKLKSLESSSWPMVFYKAVGLKMIPLKKKIVLDKILKYRGDLVHSVNFNREEYYNLICEVLLLLNELDISWLLKFLEKYSYLFSQSSDIEDSEVLRLLNSINDSFNGCEKLNRYYTINYSSSFK